MPVAAIQGAGSPTTPSVSCASDVERAGLRQPSQPMASAIAATIFPAACGSGSTGRGANPCQARMAVTMSLNACACGCATSHTTLPGAPGTSARTTVSATSSRPITWMRASPPTIGMKPGNAQYPAALRCRHRRRSRAPKRAAKSPNQAARSPNRRRPPPWCAKIATAPSASAPIAETCTTRLTPARTQPSNSALVPAKLHALDVVAQAVLQHADAIDDGVDVLQERLPCRAVGEPRKVGRDPLRVRQAAARRADRPSGADHVVTGGV